MKKLLKILGVLTAVIISICIVQACITRLYNAFTKSRYVSVGSEQDSPLW